MFISGLSVADVERLQDLLVSVTRQHTKVAGNKFTFHKVRFCLFSRPR